MSSISRNGRLFWYEILKDGKRIRRPLGTNNRSEAKLFQAKLDQEYAENRSPLGPVPCLEAKRLYLDTILPRCSHSYVIETERRLDRICAACKNLSNITEPILIDQLKACKSEYDHNNAVSVIKAWLKWCARSGLVQRSPAENIKKIIIQEKARQAFSSQEVAVIIQNAKNETIFPLVMIALFTGMRRSELFRLNWQDIDLKRGTIAVNISKSKKVRVIPISDALKSVLRQHQNGSGPICDLHNHRRILARIFRKAKLKGGWHHFRHTFITHTLRAGADLETTRALAGHGSIAVTAKYLHSTPGHMTDAVNRLPFKAPIKIPIKKKAA